MRKISLLDTVLLTIGLAVVAFAIAPAIARVQRSYAEAKCQSNLRRIAEAIQAYVADNCLAFPTNRAYLLGTNPPQVGNLTTSVTLTPVLVDAGYPVRFLYGINWVEALNPYLIKRAKETDQDYLQFLKCPNAQPITLPANSRFARVTYAFNYNLIEQTPLLIRNEANMMLLREMDRLVNSICRPSNISTGNSAVPPRYPFLNAYEPVPAPKMLLHANGSHILFADGHVKHFAIDYFPHGSLITPERCWDAKAQQWYNYGPGAAGTVPDAYIKTIAITP